jgi:hypothetical protein
MKMRVASQRIGILAFFLLEAAQCMELGRAASSGRLAEMPGLYLFPGKIKQKNQA